MSDSAPQPAVSRAIHYELGPEIDGHWMLTVEADRDWLEQPERVWPARLDPTMTVGPELDCIIGGVKAQTGWIDCASWGRKEDLLRYSPQLDASKDEWQRGLMEIETWLIPAGATVTSATFNIRSNETAVNTSGVELRKVTKPWTWQASWTRYDGPTKLWTTEGGDYSTSLGEVLTAQRGNQIGWWQFTVPASAVQEALTKDENLSMQLKLIDDKSRVCGGSSCTQRSVNFDSSAATIVANRPYLSVVYSMPAPIVTAEAATSVAETTATLKAGVNPNGLATTYQFQYGTTTAYGSLAPAAPASAGSGTAKVAVSQPITGLKANTTYNFRVSATNTAGTTLGENRTFTTPKLPSATTETATEVKDTGATLRGSVNPNGWSTTYQFEYGLTTSYGTKVPTFGSVGAGTSAVALSKAITGLTEGTTYHYRISATNAAGKATGADKTLTTLDPPETTITSSKPSYTSGPPAPIAFTSDESGSTFKCSLDDPSEQPKTTCQSLYTLPPNLEAGWHTFVVAATDSSGNADATPAKWVFNTGIYPDAPSTSKLVSPEEGEQSASHFTLKSKWGEAPEGGGVTGVTFQMKINGWDEFRDIPTAYVRDGSGDQVAWPLPVNSNPGESEPVFFDAGAYFSQITADVKFRAVFDGGKKAAGASQPLTAQFDEREGGPGDTVEAVGPANLDLLTGRFTISRTDVSIPVPGYEANLEFTRVFESSYYGQNNGPLVMGGAWQASVPVEQEYSGQAWQKVRLQHEDAVPPVYEEECEEGECEKWMVEDEIPAADWAEVLDNEGAGIAFDLVGGSYVAPEYAKEYVLTKEGETFALVDSNGTRTVFKKNVVGPQNEYRAETISWQASPKSARMVYKNTGSEHRLTMMIAPSAVGVTCNESKDQTTPQRPWAAVL